MTWLWVAVQLFSMGWVLRMPITAPTDGKWVACMVGGVVSTILALRHRQIEAVDRRVYVVALPLLASLLLLPAPFKTGPLLLLLGLALTLPNIQYPIPHIKLTWLSPLSLGVMLSGLIVTAQSLLIPPYFILASRVHDVSWLTPLVYRVARTLGLEASTSQGMVFAQTVSNVLSFTTTLERLGLYPALAVLAGGWVILALVHRHRSNVAFLFTLTCLAYAVLRYAYLIFLFAAFPRVDRFWMPTDVALSFLPLAGLLVRFFRLDDGGERAIRIELSLDRRHVELGLAVFLGVVAAIGVLGFQDPGVRKAGRVLIDEQHSDWSWSTVELNTTTFGTKTVYNYYSFAQYLGHYYQVESRFEDITPRLLSGVDVLIIKSPTRPFAASEVQAIVDFVRAGGGLYLIGEHTNIFGMSTYLNSIAERFGLHFRHNAVYHLNTGGRQLYHPPQVLAHPIVQNMPPMLFATSCSLNAPLLADNVIVGRELAAEPLDYSVNTFFGDFQPATDEQFGLFLQMAGVKYGRWRVAAFTDSTIFSNFTMFMPGKPELALGTVEWLNRTNTFAHWRWVFVGAAVLAFAWAAYRARGLDRANVLWVTLTAGFLAAPLATLGFDWLSQRSYPPPEPHTAFTEICFELEHSDYLLPTWQNIPDDSSASFHTFYVWTQRVGLVPTVKTSLGDALGCDTVVIIRPTQPFGAEEQAALVEYVEQGGAVFLLTDPNGQGVVVNELLANFDMMVDYASVVEGATVYDGAGEEVLTDQFVCWVRGGEPILTLEDGRSVLSVARRGSGLLVVFSGASTFSNAELGDTSVRPTRRQLLSSQLEFWIFQELIGVSR